MSKGVHHGHISNKNNIEEQIAKMVKNGRNMRCRIKRKSRKGKTKPRII